MGAKCRACCCCLKGAGIWAVITAVTIGLGLGFGLGLFGPYSKEFSASDMRQLTAGLSTAFCSGVVVSSDYNIRVYLLPTQPRIDPETYQIYTTQERNSVPGRYYQSFQYYMLEGSTISLNSSCETELEMYVFQGQENFDSFINNKVCNKCYIHHQILHNSSFYELNKTATDDYYFVYVNRNLQQSDTLIVDFSLNRTLYDIRNIIPCLYRWGEPCHFDFKLGSDESIVVQVEPTERGDAQIFSTCNGQVWLYMVLFVFPAITLKIMFWVLLCRRHRRSRIATGERQPFARDALHTYPGGGGLVYSVPYTAQEDAPPSYIVASGGHPQSTQTKVVPQ
jgi:hypothetical protein